MIITIFLTIPIPVKKSMPVQGWLIRIATLLKTKNPAPEEPDQ